MPTEQEGQEEEQGQGQGSAPYVFNDPRLQWAETPQGGMTNVQGPPLEKVKQPLDQVWPTQKEEKEGEWVQQDQGWPQQGQQGWPQQEGQWSQQQTQVQSEQQPQTGWPQAQKQDGQGWQQQDSQGWQQSNQLVITQEQPKPTEQIDVGPVPGGWPQPPAHNQHQEEEANVPGGWPQQPQQQSQTQAYVEVRPIEHQGPAQDTQQQQAFTPVTTVALTSSVPHTQPPPVQEEPEEPHPLDNIEQFYADSISRFIDMIQAEVAAQTDEEKLKIFTEFMENEYFVRGQRYPTALGDPPSRQGSVYRLPGIGYGTPKEEKDLRDKLEQVAEVVVESKPVETPQQPKPPTPAPLPAQIHIPSPDRQLSPGPELRSPADFPEVVPQEERQPTPRSPTPEPQEPISPQPLVINKRSSTYQPFRPDGSMGSPTGAGPSKYAAFNPSVHGSPSSPESASRNEDKYVPFRGPEPPRTSQATPPDPNRGGPGPYKPYNPVGDRKSPTPIGPERGSQYVPYDPKRASIIMSNSPAPGSSSKRNSGGAPYPHLSRADTLPASPATTAGPQPFGPLKGAKTFMEGYPPFTPGSAGYPSSADSSNIFSTPESDETRGRERESYFPPAPEPVQPLQLRKAGVQIPEVLKSLSAVLPADRTPRVKSTKVLDDVKKTIDSIGEDFSFIDVINRAYNESAKKRRRKLDDERRKRAEEQEEYTDELFADQQIGYGDIKEMEMEFKSKESRKEAKEEEEEYETYCSEVFQKVYDKLQEGIKGLMDKYLNIMLDIPNAVAGKDRWITANGIELTELLEGLLELRKYTETRHEKVQAAIIERDRKFKKTVIQPLYVSGNIAKMKSMEKHFDESEKKAYVPYTPTVGSSSLTGC